MHEAGIYFHSCVYTNKRIYTQWKKYAVIQSMAEIVILGGTLMAYAMPEQLRPGGRITLIGKSEPFYEGYLMKKMNIHKLENKSREWDTSLKMRAPLDSCLARRPPTRAQDSAS